MVQEKKQTEKDSKKDPKATEAAQQQNGTGADKQDDAATKKDETVKKQEELSEEDKQLQEELQMLIERLKETNTQLYKPALESLRTIIRSSTTSMTSVPKPLKFLRPYYDSLKEIYARMVENSETQKLCAEIVSVVAMTMERGRDTLKYRILAGLDDPTPVAKPSQARKSETVSLKPSVASLTKDEHEREPEETGISSWGHEYVKHLTMEVENEWRLLNGEYPEESDANREELAMFRALSDEERAQRKQVLLQLAERLVAHNMRHNAEADAVDLLMEIERLDMLVNNEALVDASSYSRVCLYLVSCVPYVADPENSTLLRTAKRIYLRFGQFASALRCALALNAADEIDEVFKRCDDLATRKQLCFMLARQQVTIDLEKFGLDDTEVSDLNEIQSNELLNRSFLNLATELDIVEPKTPEDVYKVHLEPAGRGGASSASAQMDSAKQNLAASFVNGLVNCAFGRDKLLIGTAASADAGAKKSQSHEDAMKWIYKQKDLGMQSTTATLGWLLLWDVDAGLTQIDKFLYASEDMVKAGALLASGIVSCGVRNECDPALALLRDYVTHANSAMRQSAALGLALAYAGTNRDDILSVLNAVFADSKNNMEQIGLAALACGLIGVGSGNGDVCSTLLSTLMERGDLELRDAHARWIALALGLLFLGKQDACDVVLASIDALGEPMRSVGKLIVEMCAYAGTGNVLKVQQFLHICTDFAEETKKDDADGAADSGSGSTSASSGSGSSAAANKAKEEKDRDDRKRKAELVAAQQGIAVLGIALIAMGEDVGSEMAMRAYGHLLRYGEPAVKRAVPLALALLYVSNPKLSVIETLGKFAHDSDSEVAYSSILSLGLAGAGTNNSRLAAVLRALAVYHSRDPNALFLVRIAQGLTHLGKGTLTLSPLHSDRMLFSPTAVGGLLSLLISSLDIKNTLLGRSHYVLFFLTPAIQPRMLVTLNESLKPLPVTVRVGQAVDVVGQAGKPKTITGFQTHTTPVILAHGERAELATEEYLSLTPVLEGFAILRKNPDYEQQHA